MPLAGVAKVGQVETMAGDVFEAGEGRIEFPAGVVHKARTVALDQSIVGAVPPPMDIDRIVELRWANLGKEARLQDLVDEGLAGDPIAVLWVSKDLGDGTPPVHRPRVMIASHLRSRHRMRGTEYRARARRAACIGRRRARRA